MERWSNERGAVESVMMQTLPKTLDSLQEMKDSIPNSNKWPSKEGLHKLDYKEKIKAIQDILVCTVGHFHTLKNNADANMNKIDEDALQELENSRKSLVEEQEKYQRKVEEYNLLKGDLTLIRNSNSELLLVQVESLFRNYDCSRLLYKDYLLLL